MTDTPAIAALVAERAALLAQAKAISKQIRKLRARVHERAKYLRQRDRMLAARRERYRTDPEFRERRKAWSREQWRRIKAQRALSQITGSDGPPPAVAQPDRASQPALDSDRQPARETAAWGDTSEARAGRLHQFQGAKDGQAVPR